MASTDEFQAPRADRKRKRDAPEEEAGKMETEQSTTTTTAQFPQINPAQLEVGVSTRTENSLSTVNVSFQEQTDGFRKITIPAHRYTPLKEQWMKIYSPVVEYLHLQIRFNLRTRCVEIKTSEQTEDIQSLQKAGTSARVTRKAH